mmetsp:Transcript_33387/g.51919  ORF Transcript_33387/g.51919 Transcript_33387/m.51919 type:complete len:376 (-) Transcript_33387:99-1226(-)
MEGKFWLAESHALAEGNSAQPLAALSRDALADFTSKVNAARPLDSARTHVSADHVWCAPQDNLSPLAGLDHLTKSLAESVSQVLNFSSPLAVSSTPESRGSRGVWEDPLAEAARSRPPMSPSPSKVSQATTTPSSRRRSSEVMSKAWMDSLEHGPRVERVPERSLDSLTNFRVVDSSGNKTMKPTERYEIPDDPLEGAGPVLEVSATLDAGLKKIEDHVVKMHSKLEKSTNHHRKVSRKTQFAVSVFHNTPVESAKEAAELELKKQNWSDDEYRIAKFEAERAVRLLEHARLKVDEAGSLGHGSSATRPSTEAITKHVIKSNNLSYSGLQIEQASDKTLERHMETARVKATALKVGTDPGIAILRTTSAVKRRES